jgi:acyl-CoA thioester hydrolase
MPTKNTDMWTLKITPRPGETDMFGHINNITLACWFEAARNPLFDMFVETPGKSGGTAHAPFIMAHAEYDFKNQLFFRPPVSINTWVEKIGNKSFTIYQECRQDNKAGESILCATGRVVIVWFDYATQTTQRISDEVRAQLSEQLLPTA